MAYTVLITDEKSANYNHNRVFFGERDAWAQEHCASYTDMKVVDVSDTSYQWDEIAEYSFELEQDKLLFVLKWL